MCLGASPTVIGRDEATGRLTQNGVVLDSRTFQAAAQRPGGSPRRRPGRPKKSRFTDDD